MVTINKRWLSLVINLVWFIIPTISKSLKTSEDYRVEGLPLAPGVPKDLDLGYAGYLPVRKGAGELFFWYFEPTKPANRTTPLIIWLQGGPGSSSMIGLFNMHGPIQITRDHKLQPREYNWNNEYATLYIDQPVGTGYSYINTTQYSSECYNSDGYTIDQCGIGKDLVEFLTGFGKLFPTAHSRPLYITGESYAGKFIPTLASAILDHNKSSDEDDKFHLKGLAIGNGFTDPETQIGAHGPLALSLGLANPKQSKHLQSLSDKASDFVRKGNWTEATQKRKEIFDYFKIITDKVDTFDVRNGNVLHGWKRMDTYLNRPEVKRAVHVPSNKKFESDPKVKEAMRSDIMKSVVHHFPKFQDRLKILLFQGQFDYRDGPMSQYEWMYKTFPCLSETSPQPWSVNSQAAGTLTTCPYQPYISHAVVLQAGHMVSLTQPERGLDLLNRLIRG